MLIIMFGKFWTKLSGYRKYQEGILCTSERKSDRPITKHERQPMRSSLASQLGSEVNIAAHEAQKTTILANISVIVS